MGVLRRAVDRLLEMPAVYAAWQATHNREKVVFVSSRIHPRPGLRVVELACGPGTNAHLFADCAYTGIDINPQYIASARRRFPGQTFVCADLTRHDFGAAEYDWVLVNSFLHHLDDAQAQAILTAAGRIKAHGIVVLELVLPARPSFARLLAKLDRGRFARSLEEWNAMIPPTLHVCEQVDVFIRRAGVLLYHLVGFVLEARHSRPDPQPA
jgi:SAM-dependent methyltransferase